LYGVLHRVHHRGQLGRLCRLAGSVSPRMYGPNREEMGVCAELGEEAKLDPFIVASARRVLARSEW